MEEKDTISLGEKLHNLRWLWISLAALAIVITVSVLVYFGIFGQYDVYTVVSSTDLGGRDGSFIEFEGALLSYSRDGATLSDYDGNLIWTETYDMQTPVAVVSEGELLIYDKTGNGLVVLTRAGEQGAISTTLPVVRADISDNGIVAVLMQDRDTGYINVYHSDGGLVASGQVHLENTGYPISLAISPDGQRLLVSMICVSEGTVAAQLSFYDFGELGEGQKDNIIASFNYVGGVFPEVGFFADGSAIAFGTKEVIIYSAGKKPETSHRFTTSAEIGSVFRSGKGFGLIQKAGEDKNTLTVYDSRGHARFEKTVRLDYNQVRFISNDDILIANGEQAILYNTHGIRRFHHTFSDGFVTLMPSGGLRDYILVEGKKCSRIKLR